MRLEDALSLFRAARACNNADVLVRLTLALALALAARAALAQAWPEKPVRLVIPFAAGGTADMLGRIVARGLGEALKQGFVVENRPGAGGALGSELVAKAAPDGYTLLVSGVASHVLAPALPQGVPYDRVEVGRQEDAGLERLEDRPALERRPPGRAQLPECFAQRAQHRHAKPPPTGAIGAYSPRFFLPKEPTPPAGDYPVVRRFFRSRRFSRMF